MADDEVSNGTLWIESIANTKICQDMLGFHLCFDTRNRRFREAFGISAAAAFILWTYLTVANEAPANGLPCSTFVVDFVVPQDLWYPE